MNLNLMMTSAKVVKTEVTTNPDDHTTQSNVTLEFRPFTLWLHVCYVISSHKQGFSLTYEKYALTSFRC